MITLTRFDGREIIISAHQIETVEATPDTVITLLSGRKFLVKEKTEQVVQAAVAYRRRLGFLAAQESDPGQAEADVT